MKTGKIMGMKTKEREHKIMEGEKVKSRIKIEEDENN